MFPNTYYIKIEGYADTVLAVYKIRAWTYEEAVQLAKEKYFEELTISRTSQNEYEKFEENK